MTNSDYRLSNRANQLIFEQEIAPDLLADLSSQDNPIAVFIGGQVGAGKTGVANIVKRAVGLRGRYVDANMDFYSPYHPAYNHLLALDEINASAHIRADTEQWWNLAQDFAITARSDVIIETAMRSPAEFEQLIARFGDAGYRVHAVILAVAAPISRLGILSRYVDMVEHSGKGRYIEPTVHDECYHGVLRAAKAIDRDHLVDSVTVVKRDTTALMTKQLTQNRHWNNPKPTTQAIITERQRPWTTQEQTWFDHQTSTLKTRVDTIHQQDLNELIALKPQARSPELKPPRHGTTLGL